MSKIYPGDYGLVIECDITTGITEVELDSASLIRFVIISPITNTITIVTPTRVGTMLKYISLEDELNEVGLYEVWPWLQWAETTGKWMDPIYINVSRRNELLPAAHPVDDAPVV